MSSQHSNIVMEYALNLGELWNWDWEQIDAHLESEFGSDGYDGNDILIQLQDMGRCLDTSASLHQLVVMGPA